MISSSTCFNFFAANNYYYDPTATGPQDGAYKGESIASLPVAQSGGKGAAANGEGRLLNGGRRLHDGCGGDVHHHLGVSAFATHAVVDRRSAVKVDTDIPPHIAALFGCAVLTGAGAVINSAQLRAGENILIYGLGGLVAPFIGPALDRSRGGRRWMLVAVNGVRALVCLVMLDDLDSLLLFPEAFTVLALGKAYGVARSALVPTVVRTDFFPRTTP